MPLNFQPPAPLSLQKQNTFPQTFDQIFNDVLRYKQFQAQQAQQEQQMGAARLQTAPFGFAPEQISAGAIQNANAGGISPLSQGIQRYIQMQQAAAAMGLQKTGAEVGKMQGETAKATSDAALNNAQLQMIQGTPGQGSLPDRMARNVASGLTPPNEMATIAGRNPLLHIGYTNALVNQNVPVGNLENAFQTRKSEAQVRGEAGQKIGSMAGSMEDMLNQAEPIIKKLSPTKYKLLNSAYQKGLEQTNDPDVNELLSYLSSAAFFYASLGKNGGTPDELDLKIARQRISGALDPKAFGGMKTALLKEGQSRYERISGGGFNQKVNFNEQPIMKTLANGEQVKVKKLPNGKWQEVQ